MKATEHCPSEEQGCNAVSVRIATRRRAATSSAAAPVLVLLVSMTMSTACVQPTHPGNRRASIRRTMVRRTVVRAVRAVLLVLLVLLLVFGSKMGVNEDS